MSCESDRCHKVLRWDGGEIYCYHPLPCPEHPAKEEVSDLKEMKS